ncbi:MAG TPA: DUF4349 domain-containing protein [Candidatus Acidoferrales bacterium]|nr:DUF4349 domain-containing protein [Candidatus Acidoferrales bacterium]
MKRMLFGLVLVLVLVVACGVGVGGGQTAVKRDSGRGGTAAGQPARPAPVQAQPDQVAPEGPRVIRTAQMTVELKRGDFDSALSQLRALVRLQGGYVSGTSAQADSDRIRTGTVTFQVPVGRFDDTIDQVAKLGRLRALDISAQDVSTQYVDLQARLSNAEAQRDAYLALLRQARSIADMIAIQQQLGQVTSQIEQLKGQLNYLEHATTYATISATLRENVPPAQPQPADEWGFKTALSEALHGFVNTINWMVVALGATGPFLLLLVAGGLAWWWRRRGRLSPKPA